MHTRTQPSLRRPNRGLWGRHGTGGLWPGGEVRGGEGYREHQGDLRESLLHTTGAQSDGLTATHGLFTGGEAAHVLRMTYARVAAAVSPVLK